MSCTIHPITDSTNQNCISETNNTKKQKIDVKNNFDRFPEDIIETIFSFLAGPTRLNHQIFGAPLCNLRVSSVSLNKAITDFYLRATNTIVREESLSFLEGPIIPMLKEQPFSKISINKVVGQFDSIDHMKGLVSQVFEKGISDQSEIIKMKFRMRLIVDDDSEALPHMLKVKAVNSKDKLDFVENLRKIDFFKYISRSDYLTGCDKKEVDIFKFFALHRCFNILKILVQETPKCFTWNYLEDEYIVHIAAAKGNVDFLEIVSRHEIKRVKNTLLKVDKKKCNIAHYAAKSGEVNVLEWLRTHQSKELQELLLGVDYKKRNIAEIAAENEQDYVLNWIQGNSKKEIRELLFSKNEGSMPHWAVWKGQIVVLKWVESNTDSNVRNLLFELDNDGQNIAHLAVAKNNLRIIEWISLHSDTNIKELCLANNFDGSNIAHYAASKGSLGILQWINSREYLRKLVTELVDGDNIAHLAASEGHLNILEWLSETELRDLLQSVNHLGLNIGEIAKAAGHNQIKRWYYINFQQYSTSVIN